MPSRQYMSIYTIDNVMTVLQTWDTTDRDRTPLCHLRDLARCMEKPQQNLTGGDPSASPGEAPARSLRAEDRRKEEQDAPGQTRVRKANPGSERAGLRHQD